MNPRAQICLLVLLVAPVFLPASAQPFDQIIVVQPVKHDTSPQLSEMLPGRASHERKVIPLYKPSHPGKGGGNGNGNGGSFTDPVLQSSTSGSSVTNVIANFAGQGTDSDTYAPPDTNGAAGPYQYVQTVNVDLAVYKKSGGSLVYGPVPINTLWSGFGGSCETSNGGDPIVQFDKINNRWVIMQIQYASFHGGGGNYLCLAVSNGDDWESSDFNWQRYAYKFSTLTDYPKMGIWNDAYYVTFNAFKGFGTYAGPVVCAFDLAEPDPTQNTGNALCESLSTTYSSLLPADIDSTSQPPVGGEPEYLVSLGSPLWTWRFHIDKSALSQGLVGDSSLTSAQAVGMGAFSNLTFQQACGGGTCIPQPGTTQQLDSLGDRLMYRLAYRNFGGYESLVVNHSVDTGNGNTGIRWYELRNTPSVVYSPPTAPSVYQAGTFATDNNFRWMGSAAMDDAGNLAVGYSVSSSSVYPSIDIAGRCAGDPLGTLGPETEVQRGYGSQTGSLNRWGDYSSMSVDPVDGSLWFTTEYLEGSGSFNWHTKIVNFTNSVCPS
jgi:hypothetical protein